MASQCCPRLLAVDAAVRHKRKKKLRLVRRCSICFQIRTMPVTNPKLGFIGAGMMSSAMINGIIAAKVRREGRYTYVYLYVLYGAFAALLCSLLYYCENIVKWELLSGLHMYTYNSSAHLRTRRALSPLWNSKPMPRIWCTRQERHALRCAAMLGHRAAAVVLCYCWNVFSSGRAGPLICFEALSSLHTYILHIFSPLR